MPLTFLETSLFARIVAAQKRAIELHGATAELKKKMGGFSTDPATCAIIPLFSGRFQALCGARVLLSAAIKSRRAGSKGRAAGALYRRGGRTRQLGIRLRRQI